MSVFWIRNIVCVMYKQGGPIAAIEYLTDHLLPQDILAMKGFFTWFALHIFT